MIENGKVPDNASDRMEGVIQTETAANHQAEQDTTTVAGQKSVDVVANEQDTEEAPVGTQPNPDGFFAEIGSATACSVQVALKVRPLIPKELRENSAICVQTRDQEKQVIIGKDRLFTFDRTFGMYTGQEEVYESCVKNLVLGCFTGYNATVLAYGQTGSGKTYTMGSGYILGVKEEDLGIIPRVIRQIFNEVEARKTKAEFIIKCSFLEIYNEELNDLLDTNALVPSSGKNINIREEKNGTISVYGLKEVTVKNTEELAECLDLGSNQRSVASTLMNQASSRSHGIFTISIEQHLIEDLIGGGVGGPDGQVTAARAEGDKPDEFMAAKFHFVDLAGSERAKKTGASGAVLKEGININKGLLALGNVIAALTEETKKNQHVPYRDSKLTRILQSSLGGNSRTVMISCCSPAESNYEETLNTLKYASRARNIKNKPVVNRDPASLQIAELRQQVFILQKELLGQRKLLLSNNIEFEQTVELPEEEALQSMEKQLQSAAGLPPMSAGLSGRAGGQVSGAEIKKLESQISELKASVVSKDKELHQAKGQIETLKDQNSQTQIEQFQCQKERDQSRFQLEQVIQVLKKRKLFDAVVKEINGGQVPEEGSGSDSVIDQVFGNSGLVILEEYQVKVEEQKREIEQLGLQLKTLQTDNQQLIEQAANDTKTLEGKSVEIERLKRSVNKLQKENAQIKQEQRRKVQPTPPQSNTSQTSGHQAKNSMFKQPRPSAKNMTESDAFAQRLKAGPQRRGTIDPKRASRVGNDDWLSPDLDHKIKHFDEIRQLFIDDLTNQMSSLLMPNASKAASAEMDDGSTPTPPPGSEMHTARTVIAHSGLQDTEMAEENVHDSDESSSQSDEGREEGGPNDSDNESLPNESFVEDEQTKKQSSAMEAKLKTQEHFVSSLDGEVQQKEQLLEKFKESQKELQDSLLNAMKEQYHKSIQTMNEELLRLEQEKQQTLKKTSSNTQKNKIEDQFKKKQVELETKLKELKDKEKQEKALSKTLTQQKTKVKSLEGEIERMKTQKVTMMKKLKEDSESHAKWKKARQNELTKLKKEIQKKDRENDKLKREYKKKEIVAKRKQEELNAMQQRQKIDLQKKANATKTRQKSKQVDTEKIKQWILENTATMVEFRELQMEKLKEQLACQEIEAKIDEEQSQFAKLSVQTEKLEQRKNRLQQAPEGTQDDDIYTTEQEIQNYQHQMNSIQEAIESLEDKQSFLSEKVTRCSKRLIAVKPANVDSMVFADVQTLEGARACLTTFFSILLDTYLQIREYQAEIESKDVATSELITELQDIKQYQEAMQAKFNRELEAVKHENADKERMLVQVMLEKTGIEIDQVLAQVEHQEDLPDDPMSQINLLDLIDLFLKQYLNQANQRAGAPNLTNHELQMQNSTNEGLKKALNAKIESREIKKEQYNQTKAALSRQVADLERKLREQDSQTMRLKNDYQQANIDKTKYKKLYEDSTVKMKKMASLCDENGNALQPSSSIGQLGAPQKSAPQQQNSMMASYKDARNKRKMQKHNYSAQAPSARMSVTPKNTAQLARFGQMIDQAMNDESGDALELDSPPARNQDNVFDRLAVGSRTQSLIVPGGGENPMNRSRRQRTRNDSSLIGNQSLEILNESVMPVGTKHWDMVFDKQDAHKSQVYAMTSVGNQLYSTANRSLKIWDIETMKVLSELPERIGMVKAIAFWKERNLLLTAADSKVIMMWDTISLTNVGMLKGFKEEIKALQMVPNSELLFAGTKGTSTSGGLLIFDLRKSSQPSEEKEKNQDVFSLTATESHVFFGCRNHTVNPYCLKSNSTLGSLQPPHFDAVTSLALLGAGRTLVSGSRDKNLRSYDLTSPAFGQSDSVMNAHSDQINTLETDVTQTSLYSGCRGGIVKVWKQNEGTGELICDAELEGNAQRSLVNTICRLDIDPSIGQAFACGSSDRSIRIWKNNNLDLEESPRMQVDGDVIQEGIEEDYLEHHDGEQAQEALDPQYLIQQDDQHQDQQYFTDYQANLQQQNQGLDAYLTENGGGEMEDHPQFQNLMNSGNQRRKTQPVIEVEIPQEESSGGALGQLMMRRQKKKQQKQMNE